MGYNKRCKQPGKSESPSKAWIVVPECSACSWWDMAVFVGFDGLYAGGNCNGDSFGRKGDSIVRLPVYDNEFRGCEGYRD